MREFVMIPYSLIYDQAMGNKRIIAYSSILFSGWTGKNLEELVLYSHYSTCRDKSGTLNQFRDVVSQLREKGYLSDSMGGGIVYIKRNESFGVIYYSEFQRIMQEREYHLKYGKRINHANLLLLLSHIRLHMIRKPNFPEYYSNLLIRISESIGISVRSISSGLKILKKLNIIHNEELPRYKDSDGRWHSNVRIFVNMEWQGSSDILYDWQLEVSNGIRCILQK